MAERLAIGKGFRALRAAGGAGLIVHRRAGAGRGGLQPELVQLIDEMVRAKLAVRVLADLAEGRGKADDRGYNNLHTISIRRPNKLLSNMNKQTAEDKEIRAS